MTRKYLTLITLMCLASICSAQTRGVSSALGFDHTEWDFGTIEESAGPVSHTFEFVNNAKEALVLERVMTSCGCTTPNYSRQPIRPGQSSKIEIMYDPTNRPGRFEKTIDIITGGGKNRNTLVITGVVNPRERTVADDYPYQHVDGFRSDLVHRAFGYIGQGQTKSMDIEIINTSDKEMAISLDWSKRSGLLETIVPKSIAAGKKGKITLTYNLLGKEFYGMLSDQFTLVLNGRRSVVPVTATATATDNFDKADKDKAPKMTVTPAFVNIGKINGGESFKREIEISNDGNVPLIVRSVEPRENTKIDLHAGKVIKVGEKVKVSIEFATSATDYGSVFGSVAIVCNDPDRPMRELRISATIE